MFWKNTLKKKRELNRKYELIKQLGELVEETRSGLISFCKEIDDELVNCSFVDNTIFHIDWKKIDPYYADSYPITEIEKRIGEVKDMGKTAISSITEYWAKVQKNERELEKWYKDGVPLFITLTNVANNNIKHYAMCYEFKKNKLGGFDTYMFFSDEQNGKNFFFSKFDYKISRMTETEFENYYIMGRMNETSFKHENDAIEYDNEIRRLFHGQREIIG